ncbi:MAG: SDR family oxidoreductase [Bryobacteraceae bacterium]|nr:SDR family oxidoreductase [Bryobacteraceae bacterium]
MTTTLKGQAALVTGAASGIGFAVAAALREQGAAVIGADVAPADLHLDVTSEAGWHEAMAKLPKLDLLILCAGVSGAGAVADTGFEEWRRVLSVNLDGAFLGVRAGLRKMESGGAIVLIGSASGTKPVAGAAAYCASKAGLRMLTKTAALEAKPRGIRVNCLSPAGVATPMWRTMEFFQQFPSEAEAWQALGGIDPAQPALQRMAFASEIAAAVVFLCSPAAAGITGIDLPVDAGYTLT